MVLTVLFSFGTFDFFRTTFQVFRAVELIALPSGVWGHNHAFFAIKVCSVAYTPYYIVCTMRVEAS